MSEETPTNAPVDVQAPAAENETAASPKPEAEAPITKEDEETAGKQATTEVTAPDGEKPAEVAEGPSEPAAAATPTTNGKDKKRKSVGGVPEHKGKKLNKKKSMPNLQLNCEPGQYYWARLKGYPPWPAIVCDEEMLPESLLASRPVSTTRADGSLRDDFKEGGKNAKERTFPVMFLGTNEFTWLVNTGLTPLEPEECNTKPTSKMSKSLQQAYAIAAEGHDLDFYKQVLAEFQEESARLEAEALKKQEEAEAKAAAKADKDAKAKDSEAKDKKKKSRKSKAADEDDVEMEDAEAPKSSKKRKKDADSDGEGPKPKKTPKVTKLNAPKTPNGGDSTPAKKASTAKPKKKVTAPKVDEETAEEKKELTEAERLDQREKAILYLRHRLQKGFLSRDQAPKEEEMSAMGEFFGQLEKYDNLEPSIIRTTKIHKVLKAIVKLASIPKDEELGFKRRSAELLEIWNKRMEGESEPAQKSEDKAPETNGEAAAAPAASEEPTDNKVDAEKVEEAAEKADEIDEKVEQKMEDLAVESKDEEKTEEPSTEEPKAAEAEAPAEKAETASDEKDVQGDVSMMTAPEEQS